jgi:hypothetical protein
MVMMMMVVVVVTVPVRPDAHIDAGAMMMVVMMMVPDHNLGGPSGPVLRHPLIVRLQQRQSVWNRIEKVAIAGRLREFRPARRSRLGGAHRSQGCGRSQQAG